MTKKSIGPESQLSWIPKITGQRPMDLFFQSLFKLLANDDKTFHNHIENWWSVIDRPEASMKHLYDTTCLVAMILFGLFSPTEYRWCSLSENGVSIFSPTIFKFPALYIFPNFGVPKFSTRLKMEGIVCSQFKRYIVSKLTVKS